MSRWRPALRMARRALWRHKGRTALTMLLVALPVLVGVTVAQFHHNTQWQGERAARESMGAADALVEVTPFKRTRVTYWGGGDMGIRPGVFTRDADGKRRPVRRDRSAVQLAALLPEGSRLTPAVDYRDVVLATGGVGHVKIIDASDPMADSLAGVSTGEVPTGADEVAVSETAADELKLLDAEGAPLSDATLQLLDGTNLRVVGVLDHYADNWYGEGVGMLAAPGSIMANLQHGPGGARMSHRYLVDLPDSVGPAPHALTKSLAAHGVAMLPRDVMFHPQAWRVKAPTPGSVDATSLALGALVVLFGLLEVVLIVGSAFAVSARRQIRDLGLVAACGGAPADARRVLLAQGIVLGAGASVLGGIAGVLAFRVGTPLYEQLMHQRIWTHDVDWLSVIGVTLLGALTGLAAALIPARSVGRLTPVAALSGRFPIRSGESRAHRPAFVLTGLGLAVLVVSGWWTAAEYAPLPPEMMEVNEFAYRPSPVPVVIGALGLLMLVGGVVWATPYTVCRIAALGNLLPLSGRFAFRDAARHRFRTAAAAVALTITVAGAVFAGFGVQAVASSMTTNGGAREHSISIYLGDYESRGSTASQRVDKVIATIHEVIGPSDLLVASRVAHPAKKYSELTVDGPHGLYEPVDVVDDETLKRLVGSNDAAALGAFHNGSVVTTAHRPVRQGRVTVAVQPGAREPQVRWTLPATVVEASEIVHSANLSSTWMSEETVRHMGLTSVPSRITVFAERTITSEDMTRLAVHGIHGWSPDTELEAIGPIRLMVTGAAGLLTLLVVGIAVALSTAEGRADQATLAAVGAGPWRRRSLGAMHGLFLGVVGVLLGVLVGMPAGVALTQVDGGPGIAVPWLSVGVVLLVVPILAWAAGWLVTSTKLTLVRRTG